MEQPTRRLDPLAVAVLGIALLIALAGIAWLVVSIRSAPETPSTRDSIADAAKRALERFAPAEKAKPVPAPAAPAATARGGKGIELPAGGTWTYAVRLEPEVWKNATLAYRSVAEKDGMAVHADFHHDKGNLSFRLGTYVAGHRSHAQIRFPGFFMHGAYLDFPLDKGKRFSWEYPWQMADNRLREGRVRRWDAVVGASEPVSVPAGRYQAVRIDATLNYVDGGKALASVKETIWYAASAGQIVKVVREGRSPDEAGQRIVAELAEVK